MKGTRTARKGGEVLLYFPSVLSEHKSITIASEDKAEGTRRGVRMGNVTGKNMKVPAIKRKPSSSREMGSL